LLAAELAEVHGILQEQRGELRAGTLPASWQEGLLPALAALWSALFSLERWNPLQGGSNGAATGQGNPYPSAYLLSLLWLARLPADDWASPAEVEEWLFAHHPYWTAEGIRPSQRRSWMPAFLLGLAYQLRLVQAHKDAEGEWRVRLSAVGRWLLGLGEAPTLSTYPQTLLVQPNLEIIAYRQGLTPALVAQLSQFAAWKSLGAACMLQLDAESVYRALQSGQSFAQVLQALERHSMRPVPATVIDSLRTWADKRERIAVYPCATLFEFASADDLNEALARGLPGVRLTDRLAVVAREDSVDFRHFRLAGTRDYALPPERCVEVEPDGVTLSIDPARSDLLVETELRRFAEPVEGGGLGPKKDGQERRQYRMTFASLATAQQSGFGLRALEEWFPQRTGESLSPAARLLLTAGQLSSAQLRRQLVLHVAASEVADGLQQWPSTRRLIEERLGPTTLAVAEQNVEELRQRLQSLGLNVEG
jgi:hypothetical protein